MTHWYSLARRRNWLRLALIAVSCFAAIHAQTAPKLATSDLHSGFLNPPNDARPMMRWWWFGPAVVKPELERELITMKNAGVGGVEIQPVYPMMLDDASKGIRNLKYMSPEFLDAVTFANRKARELGLRVDITLGSGWPYGGPTTTLAQAAERLRVELVPVTGATVDAPKLEEGESFIAAFVAEGNKQSFDAASAVRLNIKTDAKAELPAGDGERVAIYFIQSHTRQMVKRAAYGAEGLVLDHMQRAAIDSHLKTVAEPLLKAFGDLPPYAVFSDSLEVYGADWTASFPEEFQKRRGYDLLPHLPELLAGSTPEADAVRHDWGATISDLVRENYLAPLTNFAEEHKTKFRSQTYGYPAVTLADETAATLPEGEGPQWRAFSFTRWASSANHLIGNNITSAETWTWLHSPAFRATPLDMKVEADRMFLLGVNQFVGHGWPYSPAAAGEPGWSLYAAAVFNNHNPWFSVMPDITAYLTRMSWLLRQGRPANDVAILLSEDDAQASFSPTPGTLSITEEMKKRITPELMSAILDAGYNIDYIDAAMIERQGAIAYPVLVIPPTTRMPLSAYKIVESYASHGGKVVGLGIQATLAPGLRDMSNSPDVAAITDRLFAEIGHKGVAADSTRALGAELHAALPPDLDAKYNRETDDTIGAKGNISQLGFIHRKLDHSDIYYVVNSGNQPVDATVAFRAARPHIEAWSPDSGAILYAAENAPGKRFPVTLAPYESRVFVLSEKPTDRVFSDPALQKENVLAELNGNWKIRFSDEKAAKPVGRLSSWTQLEGRKYFSGEAIYTRDIEVDASSLRSGSILIDFGAGAATTDPRPPDSPGIRALLDPPVREAAIVFVNGKRAGSLWHPPYRIDITKALHLGLNSLEVRVANTAINRMAGQPPRDFTALYEKYGKRFEMQDMNDLQPVPSGLTGSVKLIRQAK